MSPPIHIIKCSAGVGRFPVSQVQLVQVKKTKDTFRSSDIRFESAVYFGQIGEAF